MNIDKSAYNNYLQERGGFAMPANELFEVKIEILAKWIWYYILAQKPTWRSSRNNVARNLNLSVNTVSKHLITLEECGMLIVDRTNEGGLKFQFPPVSNWTDSEGNVEARLRQKMATDRGGSKFDLAPSTVDPHSILPLLQEKNIEPVFVEVGAPGSLSTPSQNGDTGHISGPTNRNTRATLIGSIQDETRPTLYDLLNQWQADHRDYAHSALKKVEFYGELFLSFLAEGYEVSEVKAFLPTIQKILAGDLKKDWKTNVEKATHIGLMIAYPTVRKKLTKLQEVERKRTAGQLEAHEVPHEVKKFETKTVNIVDLGVEDEND